MSGEVEPRLRIGILGGGQLGRMLALDGYRFGMAFRVLDPKPNVSASKVCSHISAQYDDPAALTELGDWADVATYEFENVPVDAVERVAEDAPVFPGVKPLQVTSDRLREKRFFRELGLETAPFRVITSTDELTDAAADLGTPLVVKARTMGYDGKGQALLESGDSPRAVWKAVGEVPAIAEKQIDFERELSVVGVRAHDGSTATYPIVENIHREQILVSTVAPAPDLPDARAERAADACRNVLDELDYVGALALELFDTGDALLANEYAPRVHNSGHWTIEGAATSQFANHVRAVSGHPPGATDLRGHTRMINVIGGWPERNELFERPEVHPHDYEKAPEPGRKIGHITVRADSSARADRLAEEVRESVRPARDLG